MKPMVYVIGGMDLIFVCMALFQALTSIYCWFQLLLFMNDGEYNRGLLFLKPKDEMFQSSIHTDREIDEMR